MAPNALVDSFCHNQKKCGTERVKLQNSQPCQRQVLYSGGMTSDNTVGLYNNVRVCVAVFGAFCYSALSVSVLQCCSAAARDYVTAVLDVCGPLQLLCPACIHRTRQLSFNPFNVYAR